MMKKLLSLLLAVCFVLSLAVGVSAEGAASGKCGDNAAWSYSDGTLTVTGTGPMQDFRYYDWELDQEFIFGKPWDGFAQDIRRIVIGEGITRLGNDAFMNLSNLESVELPSTLTEIGNFVFLRCQALTGVELPEGLTALGQQCFCGTGLTAVEIPSSVTFVDANVFEDCKALTDVYFRSDPNIPGFVMGNSVFKSCTALKEIRVEEGHLGLKSIDGALYFAWDSGEMALNSYPAGREDTDLRIADNTVSIEQSAVYGNPHLRNVIIPDTVTKIGNGAFMACFDLQTVKFEGSAPEIQPNAFWGANVTFYYPANDPSWDNREQWSADHLVGWQGSMVWESYMPQIAEGICGDHAVWHYENGTLTISGSGEMYDNWTIDNEQWATIRDQITRVIVEEGITYIGSYSFGWCRSLSSVSLSDTVTDIGAAAFFYCESLGSIVLPENLTAIGNNAFAHSGLRAIEIPAQLMYLGANAFAGCEKLCDALIRSDPELSCLVTGNSVFEGCSSLAEIRVEEGHPFLRSIDGALYIEDQDGSRRLNSYPAGREETTFRLAENTFSIEQYAFRGAQRLVEVTIPGTVTHVGSGAFQDCGGLRQVSFQGSAPEFGKMDVFTGCTLTVRYPAGDPSWDGREGWNLGGSIQWVPYNPANPFLDVPVGAFYEEPVIWAVENGITSGATADSFNPDGQCQRAQVVTFLWRAAGQPEPVSGVNPFVDVKETDFYHKAVLWAVETGITNGLDATHFGPFAYCNRAQVVTFLHRAMGNPQAGAGQSPFTDVEAGAWYEAPVLWAVEKGITNGMGGGLFGTGSICNRAQVVTFLYRAYN